MNKGLLVKLAKAVLRFNNILIDGKEYFLNGELVVGTEIMDENGEYIQDGEYTIDEKLFVVKDGKIESIADKEVEDEIEVELEEDEKDLRIAELEGLLKERDAIIEELTQKIKDLEDNKPVEEPINMNSVVVTSAKGIDRFFEK